MCGIIYVNRKSGKPAQKIVRKRYAYQKTRGQSGFGYIAITDNKVVAYERAETEKEIMKKLERERSSHILFHHRYPTSTPNISESAHPLFIRHKSFEHDYYVVHNGVLRNEDILKEKHDKKGYRYSTELSVILETPSGKRYIDDIKYNDSEALAYDLCETLEGKTEAMEATGTIAFMAIQVNKKTKKIVNILFGRNYGNPLEAWNAPDRSMFVLSSESENKEAEIVPAHLLFNIDKEGHLHAKTFFVGHVSEYERNAATSPRSAVASPYVPRPTTPPVTPVPMLTRPPLTAPIGFDTRRHEHGKTLHFADADREILDAMGARAGGTSSKISLPVSHNIDPAKMHMCRLCTKSYPNYLCYAVEDGLYECRNCFNGSLNETERHLAQKLKAKAEEEDEDYEIDGEGKVTRVRVATFGFMTQNEVEADLALAEEGIHYLQEEVRKLIVIRKQRGALNKDQSEYFETLCKDIRQTKADRKLLGEALNTFYAFEYQP
jgi:predicted glutamine amidotransferase